MSDFIESMATKTQSLPVLTAKMLASVDGLPTLPFYLELAGDQEPILCQQILRYVPNKRLVVAGLWGSVITVAKIFIGPQAKKHLQRECAGIKNLLFLNILTPEILYQGSSKDKKLQILLLQKITDAVTLDVLWKKRPPGSSLFPLMRAMTIELATQHVKGVLQHDLHFNNFLIKNRSIYTIDAADLFIHPQPLAKKTSLENLALFFSQLGLGHVQLQKKLFLIYATSRGWNIRPRDTKRMKTYLKRWNESRMEDYWHKTQRSSTEFAKFSSWRQSGMMLRETASSVITTYLKDPESLFSSGKNEILKAGNSATIIKVVDGESTFVVKRYNTKNLWHWLRRALRPTRAATGWQFGQLLNLFEIHTPRPLAFVEQRFLMLRGKSYLFMEYIEGEELYSALKKSTPEMQAKLVKRTLSLLSHLYRLKITHGDLKQSNIMVHNNYPNLLDLDGMRIHKFRANLDKAFRKEWIRFLKNWQDDKELMDLFLQKK